MNPDIFTHRSFSWLILAIMILIASCTKNRAETLESYEYTFLAGECLVSPALYFSTDKFRIVNNSTDLDYTGRFEYHLVLYFNMESVMQQVPKAPGRRSERDCRYGPTEEVFDVFGENSFAIKQAYESCWYDLATGRHWNNFEISTIFYDSGASLVADKDFARFKAGDNILSDAISLHEWFGAEDRDHSVFIDPLLTPDFLPNIHFGNFQYNYALGAHGICISIPWRGGEMQVVDEEVTFTFKMPVKVGLYLTWLNNKLTDPDAPFPYREETLTCTFTANKGLHQK